jgi:hypothetical protein
MSRKFLFTILLLCAASTAARAQSVIIVMIDGARYTESLGAKEKFMPRIWKDLRPQGTIYTEFRNEGVTSTCPGHTAVVTGLWHDLPNDGSQRPWEPTIFEMFRKRTGLPQHSCYVVSGKRKLDMLTYSGHAEFGQECGAVFVAGETTSDTATWSKLTSVLDRDHPRLVIVNFPSVDVNGHAKDWEGYLAAIRTVDSLVGLLWERLGADSVYRGTTTMFVTNDHGRHDPAHGDFQNHGCACEGCRRIMLFAIGPEVRRGETVAERHSQVDIAPTVGHILGFSMPKGEGKSLLPARTPPSGD